MGSTPASKPIIVTQKEEHMHWMGEHNTQYPDKRNE